MTRIDGPPLEAITFSVDDDGVAWLTLNRPGQANARNQQMRDELVRVYGTLQKDTEIKVLVLTAAGERHFCAGMDMKESSAPERFLARRNRLQRSRDIDQLASLPMPTIAAINGAAMGGGLEMALACDFRICVDTAPLGLPELAHGLVPGGGGTQRLPALIGMSRAFEMIFLRHRISGAEAAGIGLVNRSVAADEFADQVRSMASAIAQLPVAAARSAKALLRNSETVPRAAGLQLELDALLALMDERSSGTAGA